MYLRALFQFSNAVNKIHPFSKPLIDFDTAASQYIENLTSFLTGWMVTVLTLPTPSPTETRPESIKTFLTAAPTPARPEDSKGIGPCPCRVRPVEDRGFELPGDVA